MHDAPRASRCALVPGAAAHGRSAADGRSISAAAASAPRTSASAAARSSARIRWGACRSRAPSICRRWTRSPTTTAAREDAERTWVWEQWTGSYEWREAAVTRPAGTHHRWTLDQLVAVRDEERVRVGCVTRVAQDAHGELALSLRLWSATPRAIAVRPAVDGGLRRPAGAGAPARRNARGQGEPDPPAAHVQSEPRAALARFRARAAVPAHAAHSARRRFRAGRVRRDV